MAIVLPDGDRWFRKLTTDRLAVRRLVPTDIEAFAAYRNDPSVAAFQDWGLPFTEDQATSFVKSMADEAPGNPGEWFQFAIANLHTDDLLGDVALFRDGEDPGLVKLGYTLSRGSWGRGYGAEAVAVVVAYATEVLGAHTIRCEILSVNEPSIQLVRRLGFKPTDRHPNVEQVEGAWVDEVVYTMTAATQQSAIGAILVGGASTRMGSPKALVEIGGQTMFDHVAAALTAAGIDIVVVGSGPTPPHGYPVIGDPPDTGGPAAGIAAALDDATGRDVFVVATDQPYLMPSTIRRLAALRGVCVLPTDARRAQVTCAVYRPGFSRPLAQLLARDPSPSIQELTGRIGTVVSRDQWQAWGEDGRSWRSLDDPQDLATALTSLGEP